ncbi:MAG: hypothetical protein JO341_12550 [Gammaproteobacteria bacterium]|nr:hypothetical protein [Gammaproteobacteria bacterium]
MSLRLKLLLLGLATLVLPWAGCRYAREMEGALRGGETSSLEALAQTLATSLQGRRDLLYREPGPLPAEDPAAEPHSPPDPAFFRPTPYDLAPVSLAAAPLLDGYAEDWPREQSPALPFVLDGTHRFTLRSGVHERMLYLLLEVQDAHLVYDAPGANPLDATALGDRVWLGFEDPQGAQQQVFIGTGGPGAVSARRIETGEYGQRRVRLEPRIRGAWQPTPEGYRLELRVPLSMLGSSFGVLIDDRDARGATPVSYGTLRPDDLHTMGRLITPAPELAHYLGQFLQPGLQLAVSTPDGRLLARADALAVPSPLQAAPSLPTRLYRRFIDRPQRPGPLRVVSPIYDADRQLLIAQLAIVQTPDRWLALRDRALTHMLNFTLLTSALVVGAMLVFAAWLARRLARLRRASEAALALPGRASAVAFPERDARDELGAVARSFATLLARLDEYTGYLRTLAGKLAHEIRTPLTIVRSSLDNLDAETLTPAARAYVARAREGSERLGAILVAMGAAHRVEEAIGSAERIDFDLLPVLSAALEGYRIAFPARQFELEAGPGPLALRGAPDLIVQLLDKLIDNAVDFTAAGARITVRVREEPAALVLEVENPGAPLPPHREGRLFESLWQSRTGLDSRPHFGLGLYIVRLIDEFHGGEARAMNRADGNGVRFSVRLGR